jgi:hypothetical protein
MFMAGLLLFAALPATSNYALKSYGFGSGSTANSSTSTYAINGGVGQSSGITSSTANDAVQPGQAPTQQANVPLITVDNGSANYYNKLHFVINTQNNPSDTTYLVSVSTDNFVSSVLYVQPDGTLSGTLTTTDYQTYATFGSASGSYFIGLNPSTTYYVKVKAQQGKFSDSAYSPVVTQATASQSITFALTTSTQSVGPYSIALGTLTPGTIATSSATINTSFSTNGANGGSVYIKSQNGGLLTPTYGKTIASTSVDLNTASDGYGAQNTTIGQASGGPYSVAGTYGVSGTLVGGISMISQTLYSATAPIGTGTGSLVLKAKAASTDVAASNYQDTITLTAAGNF